MVDLAFRAGVPRFGEVLDGLMDEVVVEAATAPQEIRDANPEAAALPANHFTDVQSIPHEDFKRRTRDARLVVRTGEARPFAHVTLRRGVPFCPVPRPRDAQAVRPYP